MWIAETLILGVALAMDAFAVTIANSFAYSATSKGRSYMAPVAFAIFQGAMPLIGYFIGSYASGVILQYKGIVSLVILGAIGGKMIWDGVKDIRNPLEDGVEVEGKTLTVKVILLQALATAIDALAVGVTYAGGSYPIGIIALIIALTTLAACSVAWLIGRKFGEVLGAKAQVVGGIVLVCIGLKAMFF